MSVSKVFAQMPLWFTLRYEGESVYEFQIYFL